ncbi:MAG: NAD(P)/FAD-dependent oxidoreductase [Candidatus Njordarchaeum guaymaensis]
MQQKWDVIVIGGGFSGLFFAKNRKLKDFNVIILEEHKEIGYPPHCAGLVSISGLKRLGILNDIRKRGLIINENIRKAKFIGYSGKGREIIFDNPVAYVIDRPGLDKFLLEKVVQNGFEVSMQTQVVSLNHKTGTVKLRKGKRQYVIQGRILVDAEGARRSLISQIIKNNKGTIPGVQIDIKTEKEIQNDSVELYFNVPDFFTWIIPLKGSRYRIGIASKKFVRYLHKIIEKVAKKRFGKYKLLRRFGGLVETGGPIKKMVLNKLIIIGDAAGHVKPTTGGGIIFGGLGAKIASEVAVGVLNNRFQLNLYEKLWKRMFLRELKSMLLIRRIINLLSVGGMDIILKITPQMLFDRINGDFDFHTRALLSILIGKRNEQIK